MAIKKRGQHYYVRFKFKGKEIYRSAGTGSKQKALEFEANLKKQLWDLQYLDKKPEKLWIEAVERYLLESTKKTLNDDVFIIKWLEPFLKDKTLSEINKTLIEEIKQEKLSENASHATVNHYLRVILTILRKAHKWEWINNVPLIEKMPLDNKRVRWLTVEEAETLLAALPPHLSAMASFTLATGLRASNVMNLKWAQVDFERRHAFVEAYETKNNKALPVPLNRDALEILEGQPRINEYVFNYNGKHIKTHPKTAWKKALQKAAIKDFRWHDLRHTWASWHIQSGTSLQELQALGGWSDFSMVLRYAHLSSEHLSAAAERITRAKRGQTVLKVVKGGKL